MSKSLSERSSRKTKMVQPPAEGADQLEMQCTDLQLQLIIHQQGYDRNYSIVKRDWVKDHCEWTVWFEGDDHATVIK